MLTKIKLSLYCTIYLCVPIKIKYPNRMYRTILFTSFFTFIFFLSSYTFKAKESDHVEKKEVVAELHITDVDEVYKSFNIPELGIEAFKMAYNGYNSLKDNKELNKEILTIIDFTKPSTEKRLFLLDLKTKKVLHHSLVAHGKNSGANYASQFSNVPQSYKSSLGFYVTAETYYGKHGYSLRLEGQEAKINDNARVRNIVMHAADYVSEEFIKNYGRLGRSFGCPALPNEINEEVISLIANGSCLFIYYPEVSYLTSSKFVSADLDLN